MPPLNLSPFLFWWTSFPGTELPVLLIVPLPVLWILHPVKELHRDLLGTGTRLHQPRHLRPYHSPTQTKIIKFNILKLVKELHRDLLGTGTRLHQPRHLRPYHSPTQTKIIKLNIFKTSGHLQRLNRARRAPLIPHPSSGASRPLTLQARKLLLRPDSSVLSICFLPYQFVLSACRLAFLPFRVLLLFFVTFWLFLNRFYCLFVHDISYEL